MKNTKTARLQRKSNSAKSGKPTKARVPAKAPFDIKAALARIRQEVQGYAKAALFELAEECFDSAFEILVACIISIRTRDEVTLPTARRLFQTARTPAAMVELGSKEI